ncbi:MAG: hypothetical protein R2698_05460 [Microthrixaceae bacterium]
MAETVGFPGLLIGVYRHHLDAIVANNAAIYRTIRQRFAAKDRYIRLVGNHDDATHRDEVADRLIEHLGPTPVTDYLAARDPDGNLRAVIAHGHHTDGWNAPSRDLLGKLSSWLSNTLVDVPRLRSPEGLPPRSARSRLLKGRLSNRLIAVSPTFGANAAYDSLDEELLCTAMSDAGHDERWLILGHTHVPVRSPVSRTGRRWFRYANSGCGIARDVITGIEWSGGTDPAPRLVAWTFIDAETDPEAVVVTPGGHRLAGYVLVPDDGTGLVPIPRTAVIAAA